MVPGQARQEILRHQLHDDDASDSAAQRHLQPHVAGYRARLTRNARTQDVN
jgi:hypothetical protein